MVCFLVLMVFSFCCVPWMAALSPKQESCLRRPRRTQVAPSRPSKDMAKQRGATPLTRDRGSIEKGRDEVDFSSLARSTHATDGHEHATDVVRRIRGPGPFHLPNRASCMRDGAALLGARDAILLPQLLELPHVGRRLPSLPPRAFGVHEVASLLEPPRFARVKCASTMLAGVAPIGEGSPRPLDGCAFTSRCGSRLEIHGGQNARGIRLTP